MLIQARARRGLPKQPPLPNTDQPKRRILVVDDNRDSLVVMSVLLSRSGHQTELAYDGAEAVEQAAMFVPDVVLLDIGLPKLNGYDACRAILTNAKDGKPYMVALTGWGQDGDREKSRDAGFDRHLTKPISYDELDQLLAELPEREGRRHSVRRW